jgi:hypothetical protein
MNRAALHKATLARQLLTELCLLNWKPELQGGCALTRAIRAPHVQPYRLWTVS